MGLKNILARNVLWNWSGMAVQMGAGFIVAPFLVHQLGETGYGLWILVASLTGYFDVLDLGLRSSLGRHIALHRAQNDAEGVKSVMATGLTLLCTQAVLILLGTLVAIILFFHLFDVPESQATSVKVALLLIAANLAMIFVFSIFDSALWGFQRFDLINQVEIPSVLARMGLTFYVVGNGYGLVGLSVITVAVTLVNGLAKMAFAFRLPFDLRFGRRNIERATASVLFRFGFWCFLLSVARTATSQAGVLIVGSLLAVALVTPFSVASRLVAYANSILIVTTGVLTPVATAFHAAQDRAQQQRLYIHGGKYCLAIALFFAGLFLVLGGSLIQLWMRGDLEHAAALLVVLVLGELLPMSQWVTYSLVVGAGHHRFLALLSICELATGVALAIALAPAYGVVGVSIGLAVPAALSRGVGPMIYGGRLFAVPVRDYLAGAILPAIACASLPIGSLAVANAYHAPANWLMFLLYSAVYGVLFVASAAWVLVGYSEVNNIVSKLRGSRRAKGSEESTSAVSPVALEASEA